VPLFGHDGSLVQDSLYIRSQMNTEVEYGVGPSVMTFTNFAFDPDTGLVKFTNISERDIVFQSQESYENYGTEDPRIAYNSKDKTYYMMYSAVEEIMEPHTVTSMLALATTKTPWVKSSWIRHGFVFPEINWSKSGAIIVRDSGLHYLIWGDNHLTMATSSDLLTYTNLPGPFLDVRADKFDSHLIESGPPPLRLSNNNYIFFYNSARAGFPSPRPGYDLEYNVGYLILDGTDPTIII